MDRDLFDVTALAIIYWNLEATVAHVIFKQVGIGARSTSPAILAILHSNTDPSTLLVFNILADRTADSRAGVR